MRYVGYVIDTFTLGLGFLWIAVDPHKRGLHDYLAGTRVVHARPRAGARGRARPSRAG